MEYPTPPILADAKGMYVDRIGSHDGRPFVVLRSHRGVLRELIITMMATKPSSWMYGYVIKDNNSKTMLTYHGTHGDPELDMPGRLVGFE